MVAAKRIEPHPAFAELFGGVKGSLPGAGVMASTREGSFERFSALGFPTTRVEAWKYTNVARATNQPMALAPRVDVGLNDVSAHLAGGPQARRLIFVNGHLLPQLSHVKGLPAGVVVADLAQMIERDPARVAAALAPADDDVGFEALNAAFTRSGAWIEVPDGVAVEAPVQLLFLTVGQESAVMSHPRCVVRLGKGARLRLIETHAALRPGHCLTNEVMRIELDADAVLEHDRLMVLDDAMTHIGRLDTVLQDRARLDQTVAILGGGLVRNEIDARLEGSHIECLLNGVYMTAGREHVDTAIRIRHLAPDSHSDQAYKGIVDGSSRAAFAGKILVAQAAQRTNAFQSNNNLLLTDDAQIDSKPELEIYADDVKCSHGATCGDLDARQLFYLRSRGLPRDKAESILTYAFAAELFERFKDETLRKQAQRAALARLPGGAALKEML
ncbi:Fe-S cluster assembly protein SufD [Geminicoccaceae bacterium 1502E]|nr:Fe-S cluster assembly protein SufD [Geminicoccaceae bacterium 1502E]